MGLNYGSLAKKYAYWLDAGWEPEVLRLMNRLFWKQITLKPGKPAFVQFFGAATKLSNDAARIHKDRSPKDYSGYGPKPSTGPRKLAGWETRRAMGC